MDVVQRFSMGKWPRLGYPDKRGQTNKERRSGRPAIRNQSLWRLRWAHHGHRSASSPLPTGADMFYLCRTWLFLLVLYVFVTKQAINGRLAIYLVWKPAQKQLLGAHDTATGGDKGGEMTLAPSTLQSLLKLSERKRRDFFNINEL